MANRSKCLEEYKQVRISIPLSPSVNALYRHKGHFVYKTKEAKDWIKQCLPIIKKSGKYKSPYELDLFFYYNRDFDIDNRIKACLDLLQEAGTIDNDMNILALSAWKFKDKENPRVEISIYEV